MRKPTARAAALGAIIAELTAAKGWPRSELSTRMGWSDTKTSRLVGGHRLPSVTDIAMILAVLGLTGPDRDDLLAVTEDLRRPEGWIASVLTPPGRARLVDALDRAAQSTLCYTADLGRAARRIATSHATTSTYLVGAPTNATPEELHHLLRRTTHPDVTVRLVTPDGPRPEHPTFSYLTFAEHAPLLHVETMNTSTFHEDDTVLDHGRATLAHLTAHALSTAETRAHLHALAAGRSAGLAHEPGVDGEGAERREDGRPSVSPSGA